LTDHAFSHGDDARNSERRGKKNGEKTWCRELSPPYLASGGIRLSVPGWWENSGASPRNSLNGSADNVYRASRNHAYRAVRDPVHPGLDRPAIKNLLLRGGGDRKNRQGIYAVAVTDAHLKNVDIEDFDIGVQVEDWVRGMRFDGARFAKNRKDTQIEGATEAATGVVFETR
jgi:hypothetical protein